MKVCLSHIKHALSDRSHLKCRISDASQIRIGRRPHARAIVVGAALHRSTHRQFAFLNNSVNALRLQSAVRALVMAPVEKCSERAWAYR